MKHLCICLLILFFAACTSEQVYTTVQDNQRSECRKFVNTQYDDCMRQYDTPYKDYEYDRQEALHGNDT